jgi:endonuclease/exonuclease/phosphatase family metal-dependent hydrolase
MVRVFSGKKPVTSFLFASLSWFSVVVFLLNFLLTLYSLVAFGAVHVSPARYWIAGFLTLSLPVVLLGHAVFIGYWLLVSPLRGLLSAVVLLVGLPLLQRTLAVHAATEPPKGAFTVLSFNSRLFNAHDYFNKGSKEKPRQAIGWLKNAGADILCLQEFYSEDQITALNAIRQLKAAGYRSYLSPVFGLNRYWKGFYGVAIFTKFPILNTGDLVFDRNSLNKGVFADVRIGRDTVRIVNIHLHSMSIQTDSLGDKKNYRGLKEDSRYTFRKLKAGFVARARQIALVDRFVRESPHKVILCGDFNDIPYSYTYQRVRRHLRNAFEDAGSGFGFTLNDDKLFFLRIDNQFYDQALQVHHFKTHREVTYSDHFPISATYSIR